MSARTWFVGAGRWRTASEAGFVVFLVILPLAAILRPALAGATAEGRGAALGTGLVYAGYLGALLGACRLRRDHGGRRIRQEVSSAAVILAGIWAGGLLANLPTLAWSTASGLATSAEAQRVAAGAPVLVAGSVVAAGVAYPVCRGIVLALPFWNRLRRGRILWALTHAQLVGALALAACIAVVLTATMGASRFAMPVGTQALPDGASALAALLAWVTSRLLPAFTDLLLLGAVASAILLPPAALVSFLALRQTTRRLEDLAAATGALRAGDLTARVAAGGEDEVGRLQADFNAMAADLERTLLALQAERDRAAGLLDSRRQLIAMVSHELRTPVATLRAYLETALRQGGTAPAALGADLERMEREVERLQRLIDDLFTLARAEVGRLELRLEPTDIGVLVHHLVDTVIPVAWQQRQVQVLAELPPDLPPARADAGRLEQVVSNLLGNAVRHTPPGGLVAVVIDAEPASLRIEIRDTGGGIAADDLPHVFERFYRGPGAEDGHGAGLGLALVKELAESMGGSAEATSVLGEGSSFIVRLPRA